MSPNEFVIWLKGFTQAANTYSITPKQWEDVKEMLDRVDTKKENIKGTKYLLDSTNWATTSTTNGRNDVTYGTGKELITETDTIL